MYLVAFLVIPYSTINAEAGEASRRKSMSLQLCAISWCTNANSFTRYVNMHTLLDI